MAADVALADQPAAGRPTRAASSTSSSPTRAILARTDAIETATMVRPDWRRGRGADGGAARRAGRLPVLRHDRARRAASPYSHDLLENRGALVRPELLWRSSASARSATAILIGGTAVHDPRRDRARSRAAATGAFSLGSRVIVDYDDLEADRPARRSAAASNEQMLLKVVDAGSDALARDAAPRPPRPVRQRALVPRDRGSDRRGSRARRELPEPGRLRDRRARRHRRLERDAGVRAAEDPQRRDPEVPRRDDRPGAGDLRAPGVLLALSGQPAGRGARRARRSPRSRRR